MHESGAIAPSVMLGNNYDPVSAVKVVEEWASVHPRKTRQSVFLEQYTEAQIAANGVLDVCPAPIFHSHRREDGRCRDSHKKCIDCLREFWMQEVE